MSEITPPPLPSVLFRHFDEECHAVSFCAGKFRVQINSFYAEIECANRKDLSEGEAYFQRRGEVISAIFNADPSIPTEVTTRQGLQKVTVSFGHAVFITCFSGPNACPKEKNKFGAHAVRIDDPNQFLQDLINWNSSHNRFWVELEKVEYTRGQILEVSDKDSWRLTYLQKPESFRLEDEYRLCLIGKGPDFLADQISQKEFTIDLGKSLPYVRRI
ncbi:MAG: hypothetical protein QM760_05785 [Nibricoccus sp.]